MSTYFKACEEEAGLEMIWWIERFDKNFCCNSKSSFLFHWEIIWKKEINSFLQNNYTLSIFTAIKTTRKKKYFKCEKSMEVKIDKLIITLRKTRPNVASFWFSPSLMIFLEVFFPWQPPRHTQQIRRQMTIRIITA